LLTDRDQHLRADDARGDIDGHDSVTSHRVVQLRPVVIGFAVVLVEL
jgi:hypothetical protein